ncbi:MAG TPA: response regulator [Candidatus Thermoplasmatota archaeon]|nr:response regulator [Candidatus Thermoplasmatota archaeon]
MSSLVLPLVRSRRRRRLRFRARGHGHDEPARRDERAQATAARPSAGSAPGGREPFVVLIVDDDPLMTDMLPRRLRRVVRPGVDIHTATTPHEASELIRALQPDAVLSDYNLRQAQNGLDILRLAQEDAPNAARILFSGHAAGEIKGLREAPIHAYLEKPMRLDELIPPVLDAIQRATGEDLRGEGPSG